MVSGVWVMGGVRFILLLRVHVHDHVHEKTILIRLKIRLDG